MSLNKLTSSDIKDWMKIGCAELKCSDINMVNDDFLPNQSVVVDSSNNLTSRPKAWSSKYSNTPTTYDLSVAPAYLLFDASLNSGAWVDNSGPTSINPITAPQTQYKINASVFFENISEDL